ncbi:ABC transporter ATP-binding protein [Microbacterium tumbae]
MSALGQKGLEVRGVTKMFRGAGSQTIAVNNVSLRLDSGVRTGIVGESGSGKSTLARMLCGLAEPTSGAVCYGGVDVRRLVRTRKTLREFRRDVQFVAQDVGSSFEPGARSRQSVLRPALGLRPRLDHDALESRLDELVSAFHLDRRVLDRDPSMLSGGQRQRLTLIRALLVSPRYLICDEVISALDVSVQAEVLNTLHDIAVSSGVGLVFIAHNLPATVFLCEQVAVMYRGDLVETAPSSQLVTQPRHAYTRELLDSYRELEGRR